MSLPLTLSAPTSGGPAALEWTFSYAPADFTGISVSAGPAASSAGKSLDCRSTGSGIYSCLLTGMNSSAIASGTVATANLTVSATAASSVSPIQVINPAAASPDGDSVAATATGGDVTIQAAAPQLTDLTCSPSSVTTPGSSTCAVALSAAAPAGGVTVSIGYTSSGVTATVPTSVTVQAGSTSASFAVQVQSATAATTMTIVASLDGVSKSFALQVSVAAAITVTVSPATANLTAGQQQQFTAAVTGATDTSVTWSISPTTGSISRSGLYTAPATITTQQTVTVNATSVADPTKSGTATVTLLVAADVTPPVISAVTAAPESMSAVISWTTNEASNSRVDYGTSSSSLTNNAADPALLTAHKITLTGLSPGTTYYYRVTSVDASGNSAQWPASPPASFTTATDVSLWDASATPALLDDGDTNAVELGVKFTSDVPGVVTGIRFYKGPTNTGPHVGNLWTSAGERLATVTFDNETSSGWQQANFSSPVSISANTTYIISYYAPAGHYSVSEYYFSTTGVDTPPLHAPAGWNGVYTYGASAFPTETFRASNYWVDVVFRPSVAPTTKIAYPASVVVITGRPRAGGAASLSASDSNYYQVGSGTESGQRVASWYGSFSAVPKTLANLKVTYQGKDSRLCVETVSIWNWTTSQWVELDSQTVGDTDVLRANLAPPDAASDYVSGTAGDGEVRVRIRAARAWRGFDSSGNLLRITYE